MTVPKLAALIVVILIIGALIPNSSSSTTATFSCLIPKSMEGQVPDLMEGTIECVLDEETIESTSQVYGLMQGSTPTGRTIEGTIGEVSDKVLSGQTIYPAGELPVCLTAIEETLESGEISPLLTREDAPGQPNFYRFACVRDI